MTLSFHLKGLFAGLAAIAIVGSAVAQGSPPNPAIKNAPMGAGQQSSQKTPMGETGTPGGGAMAPSSGAAMKSGSTTNSGSTMSSGSTMNSGSTMSSGGTSMGSGMASSDTKMASGSGRRMNRMHRRARADRN